MSKLRSKIVRLAYYNPELRDDLLPLISKVAHKPMLQREGLTKAKVRANEAAMLYMINAEKNNSKFYEMLIVEQGPGNYTLLRRWGALTERGWGRVDSKDMTGLTYDQAQRELGKIYSSKTRKGYVDAFGAKHKSPNGKKLPMGEYPVGLVRNPGFGWGSQSVTTCIPGLRQLQVAVGEAIEAGEDRDTVAIDKALDEALMLVTRLEDSSMASKVKGFLKAPMNRMRGAPRYLPDSDGTEVTKELRRLNNYLTKQLSLCNQ